MTKYIEKIYNVETGEETFFERDFTKEELAEQAKALAEAETRKAEAEAKAAQKAELLARLGITAEEAKLLLG